MILGAVLMRGCNQVEKLPLLSRDQVLIRATVSRLDNSESNILDQGSIAHKYELIQLSRQKSSSSRSASISISRKCCKNSAAFCGSRSNNLAVSR